MKTVKFFCKNTLCSHHIGVNSFGVRYNILSLPTQVVGPPSNKNWDTYQSPAYGGTLACTTARI